MTQSHANGPSKARAQGASKRLAPQFPTESAE